MGIEKVLMVFGGKGGIGKTLISLTLYRALSELGEDEIALLDFNSSNTDLYDIAWAMGGEASNFRAGEELMDLIENRVEGLFTVRRNSWYRPITNEKLFKTLDETIHYLNALGVKYFIVDTNWTLSNITFSHEIADQCESLKESDIHTFYIFTYSSAITGRRGLIMRGIMELAKKFGLSHRKAFWVLNPFSIWPRLSISLYWRGEERIPEWSRWRRAKIVAPITFEELERKLAQVEENYRKVFTMYRAIDVRKECIAIWRNVFSKVGEESNVRYVNMLVIDALFRDYVNFADKFLVRLPIEGSRELVAGELISRLRKITNEYVKPFLVDNNVIGARR